MLELLKGFLVWLGGLIAAFVAGREHEQVKEFERELQEQEHEAQKWADAGSESASGRLRRIAEAKRDHS